MQQTKECPTCQGKGSHGPKSTLPVGCKCETCDGTGQVPLTNEDIEFLKRQANQNTAHYPPPFGTLCILFLLLPMLASAQKWSIQNSVKRNWPIILTTAGQSYMLGIHDARDAYNPGFQKKLGNNRIWGYDSWKNKYKLDKENNPILNKERFIGSKTIFVFLTDGDHAAETIGFVNPAITGAWIASQPVPFKHKVLDAALLFIVRSAFFHLSYSVIYK